MESHNVYYESDVEPEIVDFEEKELELVEEVEKAKPETKVPKEETCTHKTQKPAYDFTHINKILVKMETVEEKIAWLKNFLKQLQQTQKSIMFSSWGYATTSSSMEEQHKSMTPYIQTVTLGIRAVQKKIRLLSQERVKQLNNPSRK